jgi:uncharacterized membrane-anchored protein YhcB (DUF1043 family)
MLFWDVIKDPITAIWIQTTCAIAGVIIGIIGIKVSLPKIAKQINVLSETIKMSQCKFLVTETVQGIRHKFCTNPKMLESNKQTFDKPLVCMGDSCGVAEYSLPAIDVKSNNKEG